MIYKLFMIMYTFQHFYLQAKFLKIFESSLIIEKAVMFTRVL